MFLSLVMIELWCLSGVFWVYWYTGIECRACSTHIPVLPVPVVLDFHLPVLGTDTLFSFVSASAPGYLSLQFPVFVRVPVPVSDALAHTRTSRFQVAAAELTPAAAVPAPVSEAHSVSRPCHYPPRMWLCLQCVWRLKLPCFSTL